MPILSLKPSRHFINLKKITFKFRTTIHGKKNFNFVKVYISSKFLISISPKHTLKGRRHNVLDVDPWLIDVYQFDCTYLKYQVLTKFTWITFGHDVELARLTLFSRLDIICQI